MTDSDHTHWDEPPCCKLGRAIARDDLQWIDEEFPVAWRGEAGERTSLRDLADRANTAMLAAALDRAGVDPLDGDPGNLYRRLTDESISAGERTELRNRLSSAGVDVDALESRFVSHQTVHSHLTDCLDVSQGDDERSASERRAAERRRIRSLQSRTEAVTVDALQRLDRHEDIALPEFDVLVDIAVLCRACDRRTEIGEIIASGGCECQIDD